MSRATSPLDPLEFHGDPAPLPGPRLPIGTRVELGRCHQDAPKYYFSQAVRQVLRDTRLTLSSLKRQGFMKDMVGNKMLDFNKDQVRQKLDMIRFADSVEIAGHQPKGMHSVGSVANQCYLNYGQCHSGVDFDCYLLFRRNVDGMSLVYIHRYAMVAECSLKKYERPAISTQDAPAP